MNWRERLFLSRRFERALEILPGLLTWIALIAPFPLSFFAPSIVAYFIIAFDLVMLTRWIRLSGALLKGYDQIKLAVSLNWLELLRRFESPEAFLAQIAQTQQYSAKQKKWITSECERLKREVDLLPWQEVWHMVVLPTYTEELSVLEPAIEALARSNFLVKERVVVVLAGEERDAERATKNGQYLEEKYRDVFHRFVFTLHPKDLPDEGKTKGANASFAIAKVKTEIFDAQGIDSDRVAVSVLDCDTVVHREFLAHLTHYFATNPDRLHTTFQPIPFFYNNIWDAPAPSRVIATSSSFWQIIESTRPHRLKNFSGHTMNLKALEEINYYDRYSINDDSRQFWRAYFAFHSHHYVVPLWIPLYNDAVLSPTFRKTLKNQYLQLQRWAYGVSEVPYVIRHFVVDRQIPFTEKAVQTLRLIEGHFSWATAPLFMSFVAWLPVLINHDFKNQVLVHTLPNITSNILSAGLIGLVITIWLSLLMLPPQPENHKLKHQIGLIAQWLLIPVTTIVFSSLPAIDSQTRLMFGRYLGWHLTQKARKDISVEATS